MERVSGVLTAVVTKLGGQAKEKFWAAWLYVHWASIVGRDIAAQTQVERIQRGMLFIAVANSVWQHHLTLMKPDLLKKIGQQTNGLVDDIRFISGVLDKPVAVATPETFIRLEALTKEEEVKICEQVSDLQDSRVRHALEKLMLKDRKWKNALQKKGAMTCQICGAVCRRGDFLCIVCQREEEEKKREKIKEILREIPWLSYENCRNYVKCDRIQFDRAKNELIDHCWRMLAGEEQDRKIALLLTMLAKNCSPEALTESMIEQVMEKARRKIDVSSSGFRRYGSHSGSHSHS